MCLSEESGAGTKSSLECLERREKTVALVFIVVESRTLVRVHTGMDLGWFELFYEH